MSINRASINVHDHGIALDEQKKRVKCNYCGKVVSDFSRLKCHLGGIRGDVAPCNNVPAEVKETIKKDILDKKKRHLTKEVGELSHPDLPWKRNLNNGAEQSQRATAQAGGFEVAKRVRADHTSEASGTPVPNGPGSVSLPDGPKDVSTRNFQKRVGRFFFETCTDFHTAKAPSFQRMMNAAFSVGQIGYQIPTPHELEGWILQDAVREMQASVEEIRKSWPSTGCSILLDGWTDGDNRELVNILVECPKGAVYLRSCDISAYDGDVDSLQFFLEEVLDEVGEDNVVQIVAHSISGPMGMVGRQLEVKRNKLFWAVSASHCIELMLERISGRDAIRSVFEEAKTITKFVHGHDGILKLLESHNCGRGLVKPSRFRFAIPFMTLEHIVSKKENLVRMFSSLNWTNSIWASEMVGTRVADLVQSRSFWTGATMVLKAATPLLRVLELINDGGMDSHRLGYIYETMDQAKESIKEEFENNELLYLPFWEDIDDIWNTCLYTPLHSAGYFLNPELLHSSGFLRDEQVVDEKVFSGLICMSYRMARSQQARDLIPFQVEQYRKAVGGFDQGCAPYNISNVPPEIWWSIYGGQWPELQQVAIRILSQTCNGGSRYSLKRDLAEKLLTKGMNCLERQRLTDLAFVHYNLHLKNSELGRMNTAALDEIGSTYDWV